MEIISSKMSRGAAPVTAFENRVMLPTVVQAAPFVQLDEAQLKEAACPGIAQVANNSTRSNSAHPACSLASLFKTSHTQRFIIFFI
ncbi:MAG: hypothetical protein AB3X44_12785 [Leptothrix sp. (in: b-proteobacteria)]